jgi:(E)-4-hydroxy-3-methylbut-2-enyl-diphosphate synthase
MNRKYNESIYTYIRRKTREVKVRDIGIGGENPIRVQSMTNTDTKNVKATLEQIRELQEAGSELVRITVPTSQDAEALPEIRKGAKDLGIFVPIIADIHFTPSIAMKAVEYVDKIRINPGNFADRKKFTIMEYTDSQYSLELERLFDTFSPLVKRAQELGVAMRIGTNHGSLSDRILNRYGDTPEGMVESALEFIRIAEHHNYKEIVVSMKASNTQVMIHAYRLLVSRFYELGMDYPLHLGVTEAGDGKDGRIKSSIGIGSLLDDGLGDTIRVSLTEDPVLEIPVAKRIAEKYNSLLLGYPKVPNSSSQTIHRMESQAFTEFRNPFQYSRFYAKRLTMGKTELPGSPQLNIGDSEPIRVEYSFRTFPSNLEETVGSIFQSTAKDSIFPESLHFTVQEVSDLEALVQAKKNNIFPAPISFQLQGEISAKFYDSLNAILELDKWVSYFPYFANEEESDAFLGAINQFQRESGVIEWILRPSDFSRFSEILELLGKYSLKNLIFSLETNDPIRDYRVLCSLLSHTEFPVLLLGNYESGEEALYSASIGLGGLLIDGIGDLIRISWPDSREESLRLSYDILQGCRLRLSKTEYISCPSCGRTLFDLQETTAKIKKRTGHLKGVKIAVMGCIVNGPGEMADADFGYVGAAPGKVHLYKGKEIVLKNVPEDIAAEKLIELIQENGMWIPEPI